MPTAALFGVRLRDERDLAPDLGHASGGSGQALAECRERRPDECDCGLDLRRYPEGSAVGIELRGNEGTHFVLEPCAYALVFVGA